MKPAPADWPRLSSAVFYDDPARAIDWLRDAFGFTVRVKIESSPGTIEHSELDYGGGLVMVGDARKGGEGPKRVSPKDIGGRCTQSIMIHVDDVDAHYRRAKEHGAVVTREPETSDYGEEWFVDKSYGCTDLEGHHWWFSQRLRDAPKRS
jgi:uncharacterized glyoxalase superfamily protein PhnB